MFVCFFFTTSNNAAINIFYVKVCVGAFNSVDNFLNLLLGPQAERDNVDGDGHLSLLLSAPSPLASSPRPAKLATSCLASSGQHGGTRHLCAKPWTPRGKTSPALPGLTLGSGDDRWCPQHQCLVDFSARRWPGEASWRQHLRTDPSFAGIWGKALQAEGTVAAKPRARTVPQELPESQGQQRSEVMERRLYYV